MCLPISNRFHPNQLHSVVNGFKDTHTNARIAVYILQYNWTIKISNQQLAITIITTHRIRRENAKRSIDLTHSKGLPKKQRNENTKQFLFACCETATKKNISKLFDFNRKSIWNINTQIYSRNCLDFFSIE